MTKYKETVQKMVNENKQVFENFKNLHDRYGMHMDELQDEFNIAGKEVMKIVREYENKLCGRSESNGYGSFTGNLAQKFMDEIRKLFPHIDRVGIIIRKSPATVDIQIPKINLHKPSKNSSDETFSLKKLM